MRRLLALTTALTLALWPLQAPAQDDQTLADIRQELNVLFVEMQRLRRELSTTNGPAVTIGGETALDRLTSMERELQRLTGRTEELEFRIDRIVRDGTNRIGDLEFRLVELEGGDISQLGETTTLGGDDVPSGPTILPIDPTPESGLAVGERADFDAALAALDAGAFADAVALLETFNDSYPGSPLAAETALRLGQALNGVEDTREAARAFLQSYSLEPEGRFAAEAVLELGTALAKLDKAREACVTLGEVEARYPTSEFITRAQQEMVALGCS